MLITVAVCTRNRARSLDRTLRSIATDGAPVGVEWEILVVDNGSTDETASVVQALGSEWKCLRMVGEPEAGLSRARNRAVSEARGRYIVWTDDDVLVTPGRLAAYRSAFEEYPEHTFFGDPGGIRGRSARLAASGPRPGSRGVRRS
jgi:glycosyltransferase involved in cell wall biosynthesis